MTVDTSADNEDSTPQVSAPIRFADAPPSMLASKIGRYLVIKQIGQGGAGVVLLAYDPKLRREVALKAVRPGTLSQQGEARLVREARAMAQLSHPNVVAVHDVDVDPSAVVLVMEYIEGTNLATWLRAPSRTWNAVVAVFVDAGRGLAAAHAVGLLHRDFKPANVLVTTSGRAKVTDFGIATIEHTRMPSHDVESPAAAEEPGPLLGDLEPTQEGHVMGTPAFMAPEQHVGASLGPAADQFAFCCSLWHGLTGELPFPRGQRTLTQLCEVKRAGPPPWPKRVTEVPRRVVRAVTRGLAPDPERRWPEMTALLDELVHSDRRRHRTLAAVAGGLAVFALVAGGQLVARALSGAQCDRAARQVAETWNPTVAAEVEQAFAATQTPYAAETLARIRPRIDDYAARWEGLAVEVCRRSQVEGSMDADTSTRANACLGEHEAALRSLVVELARADATAVQRAVGSVRSLPRLEECTDASQLARRAQAPDDPQHRARVQTQYEDLAQAEARLWVGQYERGLELAEGALAQAQDMGQARLVARAQLLSGEALDSLGRYAEAQAVLEQAYFSADVAGDDLTALEAANQLAYTVAYRRSDMAAGERWHWLADVKRTKLGPETPSPILARFYNNLGVLRHIVDDDEAALAAFSRALEIRIAALGGDHPDVASSINNIGRAQHELGRHEDALASHRRALALRLETLGSHHPDIATSHKNIGLVHESLDEHAEALAAYERALALWQQVLGPRHPHVAIAWAGVGRARRMLGRFDEAVQAHALALSIREEALGPEDLDVATSLHELGLAYASGGHDERAVEALERALDIRQRRGASRVQVTESRRALAQVLRRSGQTVRADALERADGPNPTAPGAAAPLQLPEAAG